MVKKKVHLKTWKKLRKRGKKFKKTMTTLAVDVMLHLQQKYNNRVKLSILSYKEQKSKYF